jgi:hypothetical protein
MVNCNFKHSFLHVDHFNVLNSMEHSTLLLITSFITYLEHEKKIIFVSLLLQILFAFLVWMN